MHGTPKVLHPLVRDETFRIAGEALRNAFRCADAKRIDVEIRYEPQELCVRVCDDGLRVSGVRQTIAARSRILRKLFASSEIDE